MPIHVNLNLHCNRKSRRSSHVTFRHIGPNATHQQQTRLLALSYAFAKSTIFATMSRSLPRARKSKSTAASAGDSGPSAVPRDQTPEAVAARKKAYEDANRIAKRYIIPALILVPVVLFLVFYKLYGNGSSAVATSGRYGQQQQRQQPVWSAPAASSSRKANKKAKKAAAKDETKEDKPVEAGAKAASGGAETKMDQKQTEEFARLMMEQFAKLAKGNNPDLKLTFNNEEINIGGGSAAPAASKEGADNKKSEGGDADVGVIADEEIDLE
ncbi:hypothetical protein BCR44DRAFT_303272 [Catenaria anguillulae PL171]|uniref:Uncharacterized protein n=1 Tax=Catenaria anguillulae PL171 TaxID=765915 RepID=A0A1Y2HR96_9FUNG|nr:hypothetical protein BCR44DRAFT_303272 [Catenaria anguillulae PL171]